MTGMPGMQGSEYFVPGEQTGTWAPDAEERWKREHGFNPETGGITGPYGQVPAGLAPQVQATHDRMVWEARNRMAKDAFRFSQGAVGLQTSYRPGGAAALQSNAYGNAANIQLARADMLRPLDLLGDYRRDAFAKAAGAGGKEQTIGAVLQGLGAVIGVAFPGVGTAIGAGLGAIGGLVGNRGRQEQQGAMIRAQGAGSQYGGAGFQSGTYGAADGQGGGMGQVGGIAKALGDLFANRQAGAQPGAAAPGSMDPSGGYPEKFEASQHSLQSDVAGGDATGGSMSGEPGSGGMGGGNAMAAMVGADGLFDPVTYAAHAAATMPDPQGAQLAMQEHLAATVTDDPSWAILSMAIDKELAYRTLGGSMTGFDNQFRTDALVGPMQVQAGQKQNDLRGAYVDQLLRGAESGAKIALFQQEQQLNAYKLQQLQALDQAMLSRHGVTVAEHQALMTGYAAKEAKLMLDQKQQAIEGSEVDNMGKAHEFALSVGMIYDPSTRKARAPKDDNELQDSIDRLGQVRASGKYGGQNYALQEKRLLYQRMNTLDRAMADISFTMNTADEKVLARRKAMLAERAKIARQLGVESGDEPAGAVIPPVAPPQGPPTSSAVQAAPQTQQTSLVQQVASDPTWGPVMGTAYNHEKWQASPVWSKFPDPATRASLSAAVTMLGAQFIADQGERGRNIDPNVTPTIIMRQAEQNPRSMAFLLATADLSDEDIRMQIDTLFPNLSDKDLDAVMAWTQDQIKRTLERK